MNNEKFLDILGDIDDDILTDAAEIKKKKNYTIPKRIIFVAAAVFVFTVISFAVNEGLFDKEHITAPPEPENTHSLQENKTTLSSAYETTSSQEISTKEEDEVSISEEISYPAEITSYYEEITSLANEPASEQEEITSSVNEPTSGQEEITSFVYAPVPEPSIPDEEITGSVTSSDSITFSQTDYGKLILVSPDSLPENYPVIEKVNINALEKLYGTKILPSYLPVKTDNSLSGVNENKEYLVYYNKDKTEYLCENSLSFDLKNGNRLTIKASNREFAMLEAETQNMSTLSYINGTPVILLKADAAGIIKMYSAYFQKDGCCFRIQLTGITDSEKEFIKIISSII